LTRTYTFFGHGRHAIAGRVKASDVGGTGRRGRAGAEDPEVVARLAALLTGPDRDDGVLAGVARAAEPLA